MTDPVDPLPGLMAALDQAIMHVPLMTKFLGEYKRSLIAEGFSAEEAIQLTIGVQRDFFGQGLS